MRYSHPHASEKGLSPFFASLLTYLRTYLVYLSLARKCGLRPHFLASILIKTPPCIRRCARWGRGSVAHACESELMPILAAREHTCLRDRVHALSRCAGLRTCRTYIPLQIFYMGDSLKRGWAKDSSNWKFNLQIKTFHIITQLIFYWYFETLYLLYYIEVS